MWNIFKKKRKEKYIVWTNYGLEGWKYDEYSSLEEAVNHEAYRMETMITKKVEYEVKEKK